MWQGRRLALFSNVNGEQYAYTYNADGNVVGTTKYTLDGTKIIAEDRNGSKIYYTYDDKGAIMGMIYGGVSYVFSKNLQGDVIGIYNESGDLVAKYEYNAFGKITAITDASGNDVSGNATHVANINPFRYRGYYYDTETGFYYLQSRYYDPVVGRFLNSDAYVSTGQGIIGNNMFAYCLNNPVARLDIQGNCSICWNDEYGPCSLYGIINNKIPYSNEYYYSLISNVIFYDAHNLPHKGKPNAVYDLYKNGKLYQRRWYDSNGLPYLDRDYTNHGYEKNHPVVPHDHDWHDNDKGERKRDKGWHSPNTNLDEKNDDVSEKVLSGVAIGVGVYATYSLAKWIIAGFLAAPTGGGSLIIAGATP